MANIYYEPRIEDIKNNRRWFQNVKLIGELDEGTSLYVEDYVYTYLYQYANSNVSCEKSAILVGKHYKEADQIVIFGVIPVTISLMGTDTKWINKEVLARLKEEKESYFPDGEYIGWMHTQPGYGIMVTTQEARTHSEVFGEEGVLLLLDPIHKEEKFFIYKDTELVEKRGYCMYYERNEPMQQYMMDYPIIEKQKQEVTDELVNNFREIGARRKREVEKKRRISKVMSLALGSVLLATIFTMGIYEQHRKIDMLQKDIMDINNQYSSLEHKIKDNPVRLVFNEQKDKEDVVEKVVEQKIVEEVGGEVAKEETPEVIPAVKASQEEKTEKSDSEYETYAVQTGDSLLGISYRYYKTMGMAPKIAEFNNISNKDTIYVGQNLKLPKVLK